MVEHTFICDSCGCSVQDHTTKDVHRCPKCGIDMRWDLAKLGVSDGDYEHISDSLAMNPEQIVEHHQRFPGIDVLPDGRPRFTSVRQQQNYLKEIGFTKEPQRIRSKGKRIS